MTSHSCGDGACPALFDSPLTQQLHVHVASQFASELVCACSPCKYLSLFSSDGLGRTGTFIAIWSLIEQMKAEGQIDVVSTLKSIRTQRPGAVPLMVRACGCVLLHACDKRGRLHLPTWHIVCTWNHMSPTNTLFSSHSATGPVCLLPRPSP